MRLLGASDRVLADRNIRVVVGTARNAAGQSFADGLEAKGWTLVRQPEPGAYGTFAFVVRSRAEHSYVGTVATMAFEYGAATMLAVDLAAVSLADMGEDPTAFEILTAPARELGDRAGAVANDAAARAGAIAQDVREGAEQLRRGVHDASTGLLDRLDSMVLWWKIGGGLLMGAVIVGGLVYLVRAAK